MCRCTRARKLVLKDSCAKYKILRWQLFLSVLWIQCHTAFWPPLFLTGNQLYVTISACVWLWVWHAGVELPAGGRGRVRRSPRCQPSLPGMGLLHTWSWGQGNSSGLHLLSRSHGPGRSSAGRWESPLSLTTPARSRYSVSLTWENSVKEKQVMTQMPQTGCSYQNLVGFLG